MVGPRRGVEVQGLRFKVGGSGFEVQGAKVGGRWEEWKRGGTGLKRRLPEAMFFAVLTPVYQTFAWELADASRLANAGCLHYENSS
jgi:hypothetical protein